MGAVHRPWSCWTACSTLRPEALREEQHLVTGETVKSNEQNALWYWIHHDCCHQHIVEA